MHQFARTLLQELKTRRGTCGMIKTLDRPSDDRSIHPYHIPDNFFAATAMSHLKDLAATWDDVQIAAEAATLQRTILDGIEQYGDTVHSKFGRVYCYEASCKGDCELRDDANLPSLVSLPYMDDGRMLYDPDTYTRTRHMVLSKEGNPLFFSGKYASGIGSEPVRTGRMVWVMGLMSAALTTASPAEVASQLRTIVATSSGRYGLAESFHPDEPHKFTRVWFDWPNSLFTELVLRCCSNIVAGPKGVSPENAVPDSVLKVRPDLRPSTNGFDVVNGTFDATSWQLCAMKDGVCTLPPGAKVSHSNQTHVCLRYGNGWGGGLLRTPLKRVSAGTNGRWSTWQIKQVEFPQLGVKCTKALGNPAPSLPKSCWLSLNPNDCSTAQFASQSLISRVSKAHAH
jgi:hypothetical protein